MRVDLTWGAQLFTGCELTAHNTGLDTESSDDMVNHRDGEKHWKEFSASAMTCLVMTLELIQLNKAFVSRYHASMGLTHIEKALRTMECGYWHAFCFNENLRLRLKLQQRGFMNKNRGNARALKTLPNLLEQEVLALECLLQTTFDLYGAEESNGTLSSCEDTRAFIKPWLQRYPLLHLPSFSHIDSLRPFLSWASAVQFLNVPAIVFAVVANAAVLLLIALHNRFSVLALSRYLSFEESVPDWSSDGEQSDDERNRQSVDHAGASSGGGSGNGGGSGVLRDQQFLRVQHSAYFNPVKLVLERVGAFSGPSFNDNCHWLVPLLSRMIVCENATVRGLVRSVFQKFVDPVFAQQR